MSLRSAITNSWFSLGLVALVLITLLDTSLLTVKAGIFFKNHHGANIVIALIFLLSGLGLNSRRLRDGLADIKGTILALSLIFIVAPAIGYLLSLLPLQTGITLGIILVAAMPTTLSSGVVMTASSGGNMAHSLFITILANVIGVVTIPITITILLGPAATGNTIEIDQFGIMIKLATLVLLPLLIGIVLRNNMTSLIKPLLPYTTKISQIGILSMVWMAVCAGRSALVTEFMSTLPVLLVVFFYHLLLVLAGLLLTRLFNIEKGKRESVILMGGQKTLPLSLILQVSLFPQYGIALVVCVLHHIIHLIMDGYLIKYLRNMK